MKKLKSTLRSFRETVGTVSQGKWDSFKISLDFLYCKARFHVTLNEYRKYRFYNLKNRYRKNFVLVYHKTHGYENVSAKTVTMHKYIFYRRMQDLFNREMTLAPHCGKDAFVEFFKKHQRIVIKPDFGSLGRGIKCLEYTDEAYAEKIFEKFSKEKPMVCEEYIYQHHALTELCPFSVNTIRVVAIWDGEDVELVSATLKTGGSADKFVDNMHNGGIGAQVDIETGIVTTFGRDYSNNDYAYHPVSGAQFIGFSVPFWKEAKNLVKEAHRRLPQCPLLGWDIAITENGAEIVEANSAPGPLLMQTMDGIPKGKKILKMMKTHKIPKEYSDYKSYVPDYDSYFSQGNAE